MAYTVMTFTNILSALFVPLVVFMTSRNIVMYTDAMVFIDSVKKIPQAPAFLMLNTAVCCMVFFTGFMLRSLSSRKRVVIVTLVADIAAGAYLLVALNCNYNGFILWVLATIIFHLNGRVKISVLAVGAVLYIFSSYDLVNLYRPLFSIRDYILYYPHDIKNFLLFIHYSLSALNFLCFTLFCINVIQFQRGEIDEISRLNTELKKLADIKEKMGRTKERNRLAAEIHDTVGHSLTGISVGVDACIEVMDRNPELAKNQLKIISAVAKDGMNDIRRSVRMIKNEDENEGSLSQMMQDMFEKIRIATGVSIDYDCNSSLDFDEDENHAIFRVVQESVTNSIRHGKASHISVSVHQEDGVLGIRISDNGHGCKNIEKGFGLTHMTERVEMLNGKISFSSGDGFEVEAQIPLRD